MKTEKQLQIRYSIFESLADLPAEAQTLMAEAVAARHNAYAPYSKFKVGAAVLVGNGKIFIGSNQENAAFPSGLCAERVAIYQASTQCPDEVIKMIAISGTAEDPTGQPVSPCGACRQVMVEFFKPDLKVTLVAKDKTTVEMTVGELLPYSFTDLQ